jgi:hypothetical protein
MQARQLVDIKRFAAHYVVNLIKFANFHENWFAQIHVLVKPDDLVMLQL